MNDGFFWRLVRRSVDSTTDADLTAMMEIMNECRQFMTKPIPEITPEMQGQWWNELPDKVVRYKAFVYAMHETPNDRIAFSLLQWHKDGRTTPLFGIRERARGHNIARKIIQHYLKEAEGPLYGEQLTMHEAICKMNAEAGWEIIGTRDSGQVQILYHPNEKQQYPDYKGMLDFWGVK